jgi:hypothetical protein
MNITKTTQGALALAALIAAPALAGANVIVDTFENGNPNNWDWQLGPSIFSGVVPTGGNPGAYLKTNPGVSGAGAWFSDGPDFAGNFIEMGVTHVGGDLYSEQGDPNNEIIHIAIVNYGPTSSIFDDTIAHFNTGVASPDFPGDGWVSFDAPVPVNSPDLPAGWTLHSTFGGGGMGNMTWAELMADVDAIVIGYGNVVGPIAPFNVTRGLDNPRLTLIPAPGAAGILALAGCRTVRRRRA